MKAYKIERWDAILPHDSSNSLPMIYINADSELLNFAQKSNYKFMVEIRGTNSIYDHKQMKGVFDALLLGPNCTSQYIKDKNWYTISLDAYFYSYPPLLGEVLILGLETESKIIKAISQEVPRAVSGLIQAPAPAPVYPPEAAFAYSEEPKNGLKGMSVPMILVTLGLMALVILIIFLVFRGKK